MSDIDNHHRGAIHMAVEGDYSTILSVLMEHGADPDIMDDSGSSGVFMCSGSGFIHCLSMCMHVVFVFIYRKKERGGEREGEKEEREREREKERKISAFLFIVCLTWSTELLPLK